MSLISSFHISIIVQRGPQDEMKLDLCHIATHLSFSNLKC